jgi:Holliday junction DNA helicase RuvA
MILELRDKMPAPSGEETAASSGGPSGALTATEQDVLSALLNLGCARPAAEAALRKARVGGAPPAPDTEFEPLFRRALELVR